MMAALDMETLLALEKRGWDSLCHGEGGSFYAELMTPDAVMVLVNGIILGRETIAGSLNDSPPWSTFELTDARLVAVSSTGAALIYQATATRDGDEPFIALMSSVYCQVEGRIQLALYQQTAITDQG